MKSAFLVSDDPRGQVRALISTEDVRSRRP